MSHDLEPRGHVSPNLGLRPKRTEFSFEPKKLPKKFVE